MARLSLGPGPPKNRTTWSLHDPYKIGRYPKYWANGIDPCSKGHGDSRYVCRFSRAFATKRGKTPRTHQPPSVHGGRTFCSASRRSELRTPRHFAENRIEVLAQKTQRWMEGPSGNYRPIWSLLLTLKKWLVIPQKSWGH